MPLKPMVERITIKKYYCLCVDGEPMGSMFNIGDGGKRRVPFPHDAIGKKDTKEDARLAKAKMLAYVNDICAIPAAKRAGSAKRWG